MAWQTNRGAARTARFVVSNGSSRAPPSPPPFRSPPPTRRGHQRGARPAPQRPVCCPCPSARARRRPEARTATREVRARGPPGQCFQQGRKLEARSPRGVETAAPSGAHCICACVWRVGAPRGATIAASAPARWRARTPLCTARAPHSGRARRNRPNLRASFIDGDDWPRSFARAWSVYGFRQCVFSVVRPKKRTFQRDSARFLTVFSPPIRQFQLCRARSPRPQRVRSPNSEFKLVKGRVTRRWSFWVNRT